MIVLGRVVLLVIIESGRRANPGEPGVGGIQLPGNHASGLGDLETFPGSALYNCLRPVTTYPEKCDSFLGQGPSGQGPRTIGCRLNQSIPMAMRADDHAVPNLVV
jgi:hypothetical protein